jgi:hypothetical protein
MSDLVHEDAPAAFIAPIPLPTLAGHEIADTVDSALQLSARLVRRPLALETSVSARLADGPLRSSFALVSFCRHSVSFVVAFTPRSLHPTILPATPGG